jgi:hypothetical protein
LLTGNKDVLLETCGFYFPNISAFCPLLSESLATTLACMGLLASLFANHFSTATTENLKHAVHILSTWASSPSLVTLLF